MLLCSHQRLRRSRFRHSYDDAAAWSACSSEIFRVGAFSVTIWGQSKKSTDLTTPWNTEAIRFGESTTAQIDSLGGITTGDIHGDIMQAEGESKSSD